MKVSLLSAKWFWHRLSPTKLKYIWSDINLTLTMSFSLLFISQFSSTICCKFYCVSGFKTPHLTHDRRGRGVADLCDTSVNYSGVSMLAGSSFLSAATRQLSHSKTMSASHKDSIQSSKVFMAFLIIFSDGKSTILQLLALQVMISYIAHSVFF